METHNEGAQRNFEQILQDQNKWLESKEEKIKNQVEQKTQETVSITNPHVLNSSKRMVEGMESRKGVDTKERLYNLNKEWDEKKKQKLNDLDAERKKLAEQSFSVNAKPREGALVETLYGDAARRDQELKKKMEEFDKTRGMPADSKYVNEKMDKYVAKKFNKEFDQVVQNVISEDEDDQKDGEDSSAFDYQKLMIVLQELSFLPEQVVEDTNDHKQLQALWEFLHGEEKGSVAIEDLRVVLHILIGIKPQGREKKPEGEEEQAKEEAGPGEEGGEKPKKPDSFFEEGRLYIRSGRTQRVFVTFKDLYINRIEAHGRAQLAKLAEEPEIPED